MRPADSKALCSHPGWAVVWSPAEWIPPSPWSHSAERPTPLAGRLTTFSAALGETPAVPSLPHAPEVSLWHVPSAPSPFALPRS